MYREAWRLQREQYWVDDMADVDWNAVHDQYLPLVDRVGSRSEFEDLLWEMQGELGSSHAYAFGGDFRKEAIVSRSASWAPTSRGTERFSVENRAYCLRRSL